MGPDVLHTKVIKSSYWHEMQPSKIPLSFLGKSPGSSVRDPHLGGFIRDLFRD